MLKVFIKKIIAISLFMVSPHWVYAQYNANMSRKLKDVMVYTDSGHIYFKLENQPTTHPTCKPNYFVIPDTVPYEQR